VPDTAAASVYTPALKFNSATVHFLYSFALPVHVAETLWDAGDPWTQIAPQTFSESIQPSLSFNDFRWTDTWIPEDDNATGVIRKYLAEDDRRSITVEVNGTLLKSGAGVVTISIHLSRAESKIPVRDDVSHTDPTKFSVRDVHLILSLVPVVTIDSEDAIGRPFEKEALRSLGEIYLQARRQWMVSDDACPAQNAQIDRVAQSPHVVTVLELDGTRFDFDKSWWDRPPVRSHSCSDSSYMRHSVMWRELLSVQLRLVECINYHLTSALNEHRLPDEDSHPTYQFPNFSWDSRTYVGYHPRSILLMSYAIKEQPASFLFPTILRMAQLLRTKWHMSLEINFMLDELLMGLREARRVPFDLQKRLLELRKQWTLTLHDPFSYVFEGGSIVTIVDEARKRLWLDRLEDLTSKKFEAFDSIISDEARLALLINLANET